MDAATAALVWLSRLDAPGGPTEAALQSKGEKGIANGYAALDSTGLVPSSQLFGTDVRLRRTAAETATLDDGAGADATFVVGKVGVGTGSPTFDRISVSYVSGGAPSGAGQVAVGVTVFGKGTVTSGVRHHGYFAQMSDYQVVNKTITGAVNNGSGLIRITATGHTFITGDKVAVYGVVGTTEANGAWTVSVIDANTFDLVGSTFTNAYGSGGIVTNRPQMYGFFASVIPTQARGGLTGTAQFADDVAGFVAYNGGGAGINGADGFYLAHNAAHGPGSHEWVTGFSCDSNVQLGAFVFPRRLTGSAASGCAILAAGNATIENDAFGVLMPNNASYAAKNAAGSANVRMFKLNEVDQFEIETKTKIVGGSGAIALTVTDIETDGAAKVSRIGGAHFTNGQPAVTLMMGNITSGVNTVTFGGGTVAMNAATDLVFYTAPNATTPTGTERMRINPNGVVSLAADAATGGFFEIGELTGDPAAPAANKARLYLKDVAGKTALFARFPTGAAVQIAIEP